MRSYGEDGRRLLLLRRTSNVRQQVLAHFSAAKRETALHSRSSGASSGVMPPAKLGARLHEIELSRSAAPSRPPGGATRALRRQRWRKRPGELCSWQLQRSPAKRSLSPRNWFSPRILTFAIADDLFGMYPNHREALRSLTPVGRWHSALCYKLLGLDDSTKPGACAAYRQKSCRGVCIGKETVALHSARVLTALAKFKVKPWPYKGPLLLLERDEFGMREEFHLVDRWRLVATVHIM
jgi:DNA polymerase-3 subunit epsilon